MKLARYNNSIERSFTGNHTEKMDFDNLLMLTIVISLLLLIVQRTEPSRRLWVMFIMIIPAILLRNLIRYRNIEKEGWVALGIALLFNFLFWALVGKYNPVHSSDEIQVLGLDD
jgi:phosphatidylserine synthase